MDFQLMRDFLDHLTSWRIPGNVMVICKDGEPLFEYTSGYSDIEKGEKIAQLVISEVPKAVFYEVENVSSIENDGRKGGFGSTGDK